VQWRRPRGLSPDAEDGHDGMNKLHPISYPLPDWTLEEERSRVPSAPTSLGPKAKRMCGVGDNGASSGEEGCMDYWDCYPFFSLLLLREPEIIC
jgi:hypothetical protein